MILATTSVMIDSQGFYGDGVDHGPCDWEAYRKVCRRDGHEIKLCVSPLTFMIHVGVEFKPIFPPTFAEYLEELEREEDNE